MFDIGWTEMLVIAIVMIVVVGPKDLPKMLRTFGRTTAKLRTMAGDFQRQFNEALKEAELDDVKKSVDTLRGLNPANEIKKSLNPFEKAAADVRAGLQSLQNPPKPADPAPAASTPTAAEPLKNGATAVPGPEPTAVPAPVAPAVSQAEATTTAHGAPAAAVPAAAGATQPAIATSSNGRAVPANGAGAPVKAPRGAAAKSKAATPAVSKEPAASDKKAATPAARKSAAKPRKSADSAT